MLLWLVCENFRKKSNLSENLSENVSEKNWYTLMDQTDRFSDCLKTCLKTTVWKKTDTLYWDNIIPQKVNCFLVSGNDRNYLDHAAF